MDVVKKQKQCLKGISFHIILILWLGALILYAADYLILSVISSSLSLLFFLYLTNLRMKNFFMFRKKASNKPVNAIPSVTAESDNESKSSSDSVELRSLRCTVIAKNASFVGDIEDCSDVQIYGKVIGNINIKEGAIRVMSTGHVQGELNAPEIIIDGNVNGRCFAECIDILEHGILRGIACSHHFSIKRGGTFIGQSEEWTIKDSPSAKKQNQQQNEQTKQTVKSSEAQLYVLQDKDNTQAEKKKSA